VSFKVEQGEFFVVMGLSGSGKSTSAPMLNGLIVPTAGEILMDDIDMAICTRKELRPARRDRIAMVFRHFALFPHKRAAENGSRAAAG